MSQETLHWLRLLIPGALITLVLDPVVHLQDLVYRLALPDVVIYPIPVLVFGFAYHVVDARRVVFERPVRKVTENIKAVIFQCCADREEIASARSFFWDGRKLVNVFYSFVDEDPTLSERAKRVRFNGLMWSTLADIQLIGATGGVAYVVSAALTDSRAHLLAAGVILVLVVLTRYWLMPSTTARHLALSKEQLDLIAERYRDQVCERLRKLLDDE